MTSPAPGTQPAATQTSVASTFAASTGNGIYVAPVIAELDLAGSVSQETLQQLKVTMEYNDKFDIQLNNVDSLKLLNSFALSGHGKEFKVDWADANGVDFKAVIKHVIDNATCTSSGTPTGANTPSPIGSKLADILSDQTLAVFRQYFENTVPNILESGWALSTSVDSTNGAADLFDKLEASPREIIAQQIPESTYAVYMDASDEDMLVSGLPLLAGDKLVFIFHVKTALTLDSGSVKTPGKSADTAVDATVSNNGTQYGNAIQDITYSYASRKIAFFVQVTGPMDAVDGSALALTPVA